MIALHTKEGLKMESLYALGTRLVSWREKRTITVVFLLCGSQKGWGKCKDGEKREEICTMSWEVAKTVLDFLLSEKMNRMESLVIEFRGLRGYAEVGLMNRISEYVKSVLGKPGERENVKYWFRLYAGWEDFQLEEVWRYLRRNESNVEVEIVLKSFWDLKESVVDLWEKGIAEVFVRMDLCREEKGTEIFEKQMTEIADYALENQLFRRCRCNFFEEAMKSGGEQEEKIALTGFGSRGGMVGAAGELFFFCSETGCCQEKRKVRPVGNVETGVDWKQARLFEVRSKVLTKESEKRLQEARGRVNRYYFAQLWNRYKISGTQDALHRQMQAVLADGGVLDVCAGFPRRRPS